MCQVLICLCHCRVPVVPCHGRSSLLPACRYTHPEGRGGFASVKHGQQFREAAYGEAGLTRPSPWGLGGAPRTITLLSAVVGEMVGPISMQSSCTYAECGVWHGGKNFASYVAAVTWQGMCCFAARKPHARQIFSLLWSFSPVQCLTAS